MHRLQFFRAKPPKGLVLTTELQRNYVCGALLGLPECKSIANKSKIASKTAGIRESSAAKQIREIREL